MIDLTPWVAAVGLLIGLTIHAWLDYRAQVRYHREKNSRPLTVYTMNLPDVASFTLEQQ